MLPSKAVVYVAFSLLCPNSWLFLAEFLVQKIKRHKNNFVTVFGNIEHQCPISNNPTDIELRNFFLYYMKMNCRLAQNTGPL